MEKIKVSDLEIDIKNKGANLSLDIGGSACKIIYKSTKDNKFKQIVASRECFDEIVAHLKAECSIQRNQDGVPCLVNTCGVGTLQLSNALLKSLNIKLVTHNEVECFVSALVYLLKENPISDISHPYDFKKVLKTVEDSKFDFFKNASSTDIDADSNHDTVIPSSVYDPYSYMADRCRFDDVPYPFLILMTGSGFGIIRVESERKFFLCDGTAFAGRSFIALCNLLLNTTDYDEVMSLANKGDPRGVNTFYSDLVTPEGKEVKTASDIYSSSKGDMMMFALGKLASRENSSMLLQTVKREDLAHSLTATMAQNLAHWVFLASIVYECEHVFVGGNFASDIFVREKMYTEIINRSIIYYDSTHKVVQPKLHFLKHGGVLGVLGALLK